MREVYICDAVRTPIGRFGGALASIRADDLAAVPLKALIARESGRRLALLGGSEPKLTVPRRRRPKQA